MPLVKNGKVADDIFVRVADDAELPEGRAVLVSAARFLENPEVVLAKTAKLGVIWPNNRDLDDLLPYLDRLAAVALVFPSFRDGRAYSQARLLRERHGYGGELRATGQVLRDQFLFMLRAGFDVRTVQHWMGHRSLETTMRYLAPASDVHERLDQVQIAGVLGDGTRRAGDPIPGVAVQPTKRGRPLTNSPRPR